MVWWYILGIYLIIAFIVMGAIIDYEAENTMREWGSSLLIGLVWFIILLISLGRFIRERVKNR